MGEALRVDELWGPTAMVAPGDAPHLETNKWIAPVISTAPQRALPRRDPKGISFLGHTILWIPDRERPFPEWIKEALIQLLAFDALPVGWDSYGGRPLQQPAVGPILKLIFRIHHLGRQARLVPLPDGGVGVRLNAEDRNLEIDIRSNGKAEALLERAGADDVEIGPEASLADAEQILGQFFQA